MDTYSATKIFHFDQVVDDVSIYLQKVIIDDS